MAALFGSGATAEHTSPDESRQIWTPGGVSRTTSGVYPGWFPPGNPICGSIACSSSLSCASVRQIGVCRFPIGPFGSPYHTSNPVVGQPLAG